MQTPVISVDLSHIQNDVSYISSDGLIHNNSDPLSHGEKDVVIESEVIEQFINNRYAAAKLNEPETADDEGNEEEFVDGVDEIDSPAPTRQSTTYAAKKTVAQGMMDVALITANANQMKYMVEFGQESPTFYLNIALISISLLLQMAVGVSLIFKGKFEKRGEDKRRHVSMVNNYVLIGVFLITLINVFIASFTITVPPVSTKSN